MHRSATSWPFFSSSSSTYSHLSSTSGHGHPITTWLRRHMLVFLFGAFGGAFLSGLLFTLLIMSHDLSSSGSSSSSSLSPLATFSSHPVRGRITPFFMPSRGGANDDDDDDDTFPVANERSFEQHHTHRHARNLRLRGKINATSDATVVVNENENEQSAHDDDNQDDHHHDKDDHDHDKDNDNSNRDTHSDDDDNAIDPRLVLRPGHAATRLVSCLESRGPADAVIVPTRTRPSFVVTVMSDSAHHMQSHDLLHHGATDIHLLHVLAPLLHAECSRVDGGRVFLDASAEIGFWPLYAAHVGCRVIALETNADMLRAINSSICADEELSSQIDVRRNVLATRNGPVLTYNHLDRTRESEPAEQLARDRFSCETSMGSPCSMQPGVTLERLLDDAGEREVFLLRLPGDALSIDALLNSSLVQSGRLTHIVLPLRPRLVGLDRAARLISTLDDLGFDLSEMPYMPPDHQVSFFELLRSFVSSLSTLTSHSRPVDWDERQQYAETLFACEDEAKACRADVIFSFANTHFIGGVVPAPAAPAEPAVGAAQVVSQGGGDIAASVSAASATPTVPATPAAPVNDAADKKRADAAKEKTDKKQQEKNDEKKQKVKNEKKEEKQKTKERTTTKPK